MDSCFRRLGTDNYQSIHGMLMQRDGLRTSIVIVIVRVHVHPQRFLYKASN